jgi:hypothetical protein
MVLFKLGRREAEPQKVPAGNSLRNLCRSLLRQWNPRPSETIRGPYVTSVVVGVNKTAGTRPTVSHLCEVFTVLMSFPQFAEVW